MSIIIFPKFPVFYFRTIVLHLTGLNNVLRMFVTSLLYQPLTYIQGKLLTIIPRA